MLSKAFLCILDPRQTVLPLQNTEGNGSAVTAAMGTLIHQQHIMPQFHCQGCSAAQIPQGTAPIAVKLDLQRGSLLHLIVSSKELPSVKGTDGNRLIGNLIQLCDAFPQSILILAVLLLLRNQIHIFIPLARCSIKHHPIGIVGNHQHTGQQDSQNHTDQQHPLSLPCPCIIARDNQ